MDVCVSINYKLERLHQCKMCENDNFVRGRGRGFERVKMIDLVVLKYYRRASECIRCAQNSKISDAWIVGIFEVVIGESLTQKSKNMRAKSAINSIVVNHNETKKDI